MLVKKRITRYNGNKVAFSNVSFLKKKKKVIYIKKKYC